MDGVKRSRGRPPRASLPAIAPSSSRAALHEEARSRIRRLIVNGQLNPGASLGEAALSQALGMSRTPIREALKLLALEGLVKLHSNRGAFVAAVNAEEIADLFEVASGLEGMAARLAAARATEEELTLLAALQERMDADHASGDLEHYFELNQRIHMTIVAASRNLVLRESHELVFARVERLRYLALAAHGRWAESVNEHHQILAALQSRNGRRAEDLLVGHVQRTGQLALELLGKGPAPSAVPAVNGTGALA